MAAADDEIDERVTKIVDDFLDPILDRGEDPHGFAIALIRAGVALHMLSDGPLDTAALLRGVADHVERQGAN